MLSYEDEEKAAETIARSEDDNCTMFQHCRVVSNIQGTNSRKQNRLTSKEEALRSKLTTNNEFKASILGRCWTVNDDVPMKFQDASFGNLPGVRRMRVVLVQRIGVNRNFVGAIGFLVIQITPPHVEWPPVPRPLAPCPRNGDPHHGIYMCLCVLCLRYVCYGVVQQHHEPKVAT